MKKSRALARGAVLPAGSKHVRGSIALVILLSLVFLVMDKVGHPAITQFRTQVTDTVVPVLGVLARPFAAVQSAAEWGSEMVALREENILLKNENIQLLKWQAAAREIESENQALRALLQTVPVRAPHYITAKIVSDTGGPYMHAALINAGSETGVKADQAVIAAEGLLGRVVESGKTSARILLLSDMNSRVPVIIEGSKQKSILAGTGTSQPLLSYLPVGTEVEAGERVVTSGDGGIFPAGIPVGRVVAMRDGTTRVQLFADAAKTSFVRTVDYKF